MVLTFATLLVALALWLLGLGLVRLAERAGAGVRTALERQALAVLVGLAFGPVLYAHAVLVFGPLSIGAGRVALGVLAALGAALVLASRRSAQRANPAPPPAGPSGGPNGGPSDGRADEPFDAAQGLALAAILAGSLFALFYAASMPMHVFDPVYHFAYKGKLVFHEGFRGASWTDIGAPLGRIMTHPNYPPGLPALHAQVGAAGGGFSEDATRPLMALFALATTALLWCVLRPRGRTPALLGALVFAWLPLLFYSQLPQNPWTWTNDEPQFLASLEFSWQRFGLSALALVFGSRYAQEHWSHLGNFRIPDGWTLDGAGDLPLAAVLFAGVLCLGRALAARGGRGDALLAGLLLGGAAMLKNEGLALAVLAVALFGALALARAVRGERVEHLRRLGLVAAGMALCCGPWLAIRAEIPSIDEDYPAAAARIFGVERGPEPGPYARNPDSPAAALARVPVVAAGFGQAFANPLRWGLVWPLFGAVLLWRAARPRALMRHPLAPHLAWVLAGTLAYAAVLVVTPWDLPSLFTTAIPDRLLLHVAPVVLWLCFALMWRRADGT